MDLQEQLQHYETKRLEIIQKLKTLRSDLDKAHKKATRYRKRRDALKNERRALVDKVQPLISSREVTSDELDQLHRRRDFLKRQAKTTSGPKFKVLDDFVLENMSSVELKYHLYELEFHQQSTSLTKEEEAVLIDEISRIEKRIESAEIESEKLKAQYFDRSIPKNKTELQMEISTLSSKIDNAKSTRNQSRDDIQRAYDKINPLKEQEDEAHIKFVENLQTIDGSKVVVDSLQEELDSLKRKIAQTRSLIKKEKIGSAIEELEIKINNLLDKKKNGEDLSDDEMEFLLSHGHVPF